MRLESASSSREGLAVRLHYSIHLGAELMSAPSRRPEIRRRRTRKEKIAKLRKRLAKATSDSERKTLAGKLNRLALRSPGHPLEK